MTVARSIPAVTKPSAYFIQSIVKSTIYCTRSPIEIQHAAISHRWQERSEKCKTFVVCVDGKSEYRCLLTEKEVENLKVYLTTWGRQGIWLDYVCMNPNNDMTQQIRRLALLYANATSFLLGSDLEPTMPPLDYLTRAWCYQERMYGAVRFPWGQTNGSLSTIIAFAKDSTRRLPGFLDCHELFHRSYDEVLDSWRVNNMTRQVAVHYPHAKYAAAKLAKYLRLRNREDATCRDISFATLRLRELISCDYEVDLSDLHLHVFECNAAFDRDRFLGPWNIILSREFHYTSYHGTPLIAWQRLIKRYPEANFAFYAPRYELSKPYGGLTGFATVPQVLSHLLGTQLDSIAPHPLRGLKTCRFEKSNETYTLAWSSDYIGLAWDKGVISHKTYRFVISSSCLKHGRTLPTNDTSSMRKFYALLERLQALGGIFDNLELAAQCVKSEMEYCMM